MTLVDAVITEPVATEAGLVAGIPANDVSVAIFKGIPYAAAPVGDQSWRAPRPPAPWEGVRAVGRFGDICPQVQRNTNDPMSEDCLFLNVWTPAASPDALLRDAEDPVIG